MSQLEGLGFESSVDPGIDLFPTLSHHNIVMHGAHVAYSKKHQASEDTNCCDLSKDSPFYLFGSLNYTQSYNNTWSRIKTYKLSLALWLG